MKLYRVLTTFTDVTGRTWNQGDTIREGDVNADEINVQIGNGNVQADNAEAQAASDELAKGDPADDDKDEETPA